MNQPVPTPDKPARAPKAVKATPDTGASSTAQAKADAKVVLVRDSYTMPELEYAQLDALKRRALALGHPVKKSELLRAGVATLAAMADAALLSAVQAVPPLKTGRPKGSKTEAAAPVAAEKPVKAAKPAKPAKAPKAEKVEKVEKVEKAAKPEKTEKTGKPAKLAKPAKAQPVAEVAASQAVVRAGKASSGKTAKRAVPARPVAQRAAPQA